MENLKKLIIAVVVLVIAGYTFYQTKDVIAGPRIFVEEPTNGEVFKNSAIEIKGTAENISYITLDDRQIFVDEEGNFQEKLLLSAGYNVIEIEAKDRFGRVEQKKLEVVYKPELQQTDENKQN